MKKGLLLGFITLVLASCSSQNDTLMSENQIGSLQATDSIEVAAASFTADSIAYERLETGQLVGFSVFSNNEKKKLQFKGNLDQGIEVVQVFDSFYKSKKGIGVGSSIADLKKAYTIEQVIPSIKSISIYVKESPLLFLIDRSELSENLKYSFDPIDPIQLPAEALINQVIISW